MRTTGKLASYAANRCMRGVGSHVVKVNLLSEELRQDVQTQENRHPTQELIHEVYVELVPELVSNYLTQNTVLTLTLTLTQQDKREVQQDTREVTRTDCSLMATIALLLEEF